MRNEPLRDAILQFDEAWIYLSYEVRAEMKGKPFAVPPLQSFLLRTLDQCGSMRMSDLAGRMDVSLGGCTTLVDRALEEGLVERQRDEEDRRVVWVTLSEKGKAVLEEIRQLRAELLARHFEELAPEKRQKLTDLLQQAADILMAERAVLI